MQFRDVFDLLVGHPSKNHLTAANLVFAVP